MSFENFECPPCALEGEGNNNDNNNKNSLPNFFDINDFENYPDNSNNSNQIVQPSIPLVSQNNKQDKNKIEEKKAEEQKKEEEIQKEVPYQMEVEQYIVSDSNNYYNNNHNKNNNNNNNSKPHNKKNDGKYIDEYDYIFSQLDTKNNPNPYYCSFHKKDYLTKEKYEAHMSSNHNDKFKCPICGHQTLNANELYYHQQTHNNKETKEYKCQYCHRNYKTNEILLNHINSAHNDKYKCPTCGKQLPNTFLLQKHQKSHNKQFICQYCNKTYPSNEILRNHINSTHNPKFQCSQCGKQLNNASELLTHETTHRQFVCGYCNKIFDTEEKLRSHINSSHYNNFKCQKCGKQFQNSASLQQHEATHKQYICDYCFRAYATEEILKNHINSAHNEKFRCKTCGKQLHNTSSLKAHEASHKKYICQYCNKAYDTEKILNNHINSTHNEKFRCQTCGKQFQNAVSLQQHDEVSHKKYVCQYCQKALSNESLLKDHEYYHIIKDSNAVIESQKAEYIRLHPNEGLNYFCDFCSAKYPNQDLLDLHQQVNYHYSKSKYLSNVNVPGFSQPNIENNNFVKVSSTNWNYEEFTCPLDGEKFSKKYELKNHVAYYHPLYCYKHNKTFKKKDDLASHRKAKHCEF